MMLCHLKAAMEVEMELGRAPQSKKNLETDGVLYILVEMGLGCGLSSKKILRRVEYCTY
jgi:hypothetical protein